MTKDLKRTTNVLGMMSGTSLDGLDLALCRFSPCWDGWEYDLVKADTIDYPAEWTEKLSRAHQMAGFDLMTLHRDYGKLCGRIVREYLKDQDLKTHLIASHGHTVFHEPQKGITFQMGDGNEIAAITGIPVVWDFRSADLALGGQGAPLVPVGDLLLFGEYEYCLNLGGFSNVSYDQRGKRIAFDICPVNIVLNRLASELGEAYDNKGQIASTGRIHLDLLDKLNSIAYYGLPAPKSLGREWLEEHFNPILDQYTIPMNDKLRTVNEHIAIQLARAVESVHSQKILVTGGGAFNEFLMHLFREKTNHQVVIPNDTLVKFKEAIVFAFLGLMRFNGRVNCFSSVTGASSDSSSGLISAP
jgi:anhydro-N-acetylmuramic acid kinase